MLEHLNATSVLLNSLGFLIGAPAGFLAGRRWRARHDEEVIIREREAKHHDAAE